jgi:hypothetical protein
MAAKQLNRRFLGMELDPEYHQAAAKRLRAALGIPTSPGFYAPQLEQASRPLPPLGGALDI